MDLLAILVWPASVDGKRDGVVVKDGWIASGSGLKPEHFQRVPYTQLALEAFRRNDLTSIKREHVVPRDTLRNILLRTNSVEDSVRVIKEYSIVALVHDSEDSRIKPRYSMPKGWASNINWSRSPLPERLPSPWDRYSNAFPRVTPMGVDGKPVY